MILNICYNDNCEQFFKDVCSFCQEQFPEIKINSFNEDNFKEKKKAYKLKGGYSARMTPFMLLTTDEKAYIKAFYSESKECTINHLNNLLSNYK